jgi:hypothetical protein
MIGRIGKLWCGWWLAALLPGCAFFSGQTVEESRNLHKYVNPPDAQTMVVYDAVRPAKPDLESTLVKRGAPSPDSEFKHQYKVEPKKIDPKELVPLPGAEPEPKKAGQPVIEVKKGTPVVEPGPKPVVEPPMVLPTLPPETRGPEAKGGKHSALALALQCMLDDEHQEALQHLQGYDQETQEFFLRILPTLTVFAKKRLDQLTPTEVAVLNDQLHNLMVTLRPRSELVIDKMCYCESVKSFGVFAPLQDGHPFLVALKDRPGELVQLYVELKNFSSELRDGRYETKLSSSIEIRDARNEKVWSYTYDDSKQPRRSLSRPSDYFIPYSFCVPQELPEGTYRLMVQIVDETMPDHRVARKELPFRVAASR